MIDWFIENEEVICCVLGGMVVGIIVGIIVAIL